MCSFQDYENYCELMSAVTVMITRKAMIDRPGETGFIIRHIEVSHTTVKAQISYGFGGDRDLRVFDDEFPLAWLADSGMIQAYARRKNSPAAQRPAAQLPAMLTSVQRVVTSIGAVARRRTGSDQSQALQHYPNAAQKDAVNVPDWQKAPVFGTYTLEDGNVHVEAFSDLYSYGAEQNGTVEMAAQRQEVSFPVECLWGEG